MTHDMMDNVQATSHFLNVIAVFLWIAAVSGYTILAVISNRTYRDWPFYRCLCWYMGCSCILIITAGPLAAASHLDFRIHMIGHLLLGMLSPLLVALSAPVTLLLRSLPVRLARRFSRLLRSPIPAFISHPVVASLLNTGGLWILYTTLLYTWMHQYMWVSLLVHLHIWLAGYIFTISILYIDPAAHRYSYIYRAIVFVTAGAFHSILAKYIYAYSPTGVNAEAAQSGALWMYYGGDLVQLFIIIIFCYQWYRSTRISKTKTGLLSGVQSS